MGTRGLLLTPGMLLGHSGPAATFSSAGDGHATHRHPQLHLKKSSIIWGIKKVSGRQKLRLWGQNLRDSCISGGPEVRFNLQANL